MKGPILVVLAAGMGSRYGGLKQMDKIGKNGEVLLDFSVYDAVKSGFEKIVFIIRHDIERDFSEQVLARMGSNVRYVLAFQEPDSLIPPDIFAAAQKAGRTKPWGTGHALLCAAEKLDAPFTVINADDFYGRQAFDVMCSHLRSQTEASSIVPYRLEKTLSLQGTVARGICEIKDGYLTGVDELTAIEKKDGRIINIFPDGSVRELVPETPVSMNFWGFSPDILPKFQEYFETFLGEFLSSVAIATQAIPMKQALTPQKTSSDPDKQALTPQEPSSDPDKQALTPQKTSSDPAKTKLCPQKTISDPLKIECYIPKAVDHFIKHGITKVKVLSADSDWFGVTYKEDREAAIKKIDELTSAGVYPSSLW